MRDLTYRLCESVRAVLIAAKQGIKDSTEEGRASLRSSDKMNRGDCTRKSRVALDLVLASAAFIHLDDWNKIDVLALGASSAPSQIERIPPPEQLWLSLRKLLHLDSSEAAQKYPGSRQSAIPHT